MSPASRSPLASPLARTANLELDDLSKSYGAVRAVDGVTLGLGADETLALLGPSGCGKSTLLRLVAGLERPDRGRLLLGGVEITDLRPQQRGVGMVFQSFALFPHLDVSGNVAFGLVEAGVSGSAKHRRVAELLELVGLLGLERRPVDRLSGGQQQRVALARALATEPRLLLLDEPLSDLDRALRQSLQEELRVILSRVGTSAIYVTHDQNEAFALADRVALMRAGRLEQIGASEQLLQRPSSGWVARFLGHENVYGGAQLALLPVATASGDEVLLRADVTRLRHHQPPSSSVAPGNEASVGTPQRSALGTTVAVTVSHAVREGIGWRVELNAAAWGVPVVWRGFDRELSATPTAGEEWWLQVPAGAWHVMRSEA